MVAILTCLLGDFVQQSLLFIIASIACATMTQLGKLFCKINVLDCMTYLDNPIKLK